MFVNHPWKLCKGTLKSWIEFRVGAGYFSNTIKINKLIMAMSLNKVQLIGNLTRDPELKQIPGGQVVVSFGMATNFTWKDQSGERQSKAEFHNIVAWRKLAEICGQYLKKGSKVYIEGRLQTRDWEGEDGTKRYRTEITADNMIMLDSRGGGGAPMEREAAGIPVETAKTEDLPDVVQPIAVAGESAATGEPVAAGNEEKKEEDVTIDDLPF